MRNDKVLELQGEVARIESRLDDLLASLSKFEDREGRAFDISKTIPSTDSSLSDLRARHAAITGLVKKLNPKGASNVPLSFFTAATNALRSIGNAADQIDQHITQVTSSQGLQSFDYSNFMANAVNGNQINFQGPTKTLFDNSEAYLTAFHNIFQAINPTRAAFNFSSATDAFSKSISRSSNLRQELNDALKKAQAALEAIEGKEGELAALVTRANTDAAAITEQVGRASEDARQIEEFREQIAEISESAANLQKAVAAYDSQFSEFDESLAKRNKEFDSGKDKLNALLAELEDQKEYIRTIIEQSDNMLSSATVAGLSSEFKTIKDDLTSQLELANKWFIGAIAFLFVSAIPLILFIFAPFIAPLISDDQSVIASIASMGEDDSGWQYVGKVFARFVILLPAIWLVTFCTSRYNSLFKLREHYAYKYSMAVAVDGFKKQAPGHEELIAALVFEQLAFNPADKLGKRSAEHDEGQPNPAMQLLVSLLRKQVNKDTEG